MERQKKRRELLLISFDEIEIENDWLRHPPQKDGDSRQDIRVNLS